MSFHDELDGTQRCTEAPELFFPSAGRDADTARAKELCRACRFQPRCLAYALAHDLHGTWGGATRNERITYQHERQIKPIPVTIHQPGARRPEAVI